jgi:hypothetical protein
MHVTGSQLNHALEKLLQELAKVSVSREIDAVPPPIWTFDTALLAKLLADDLGS